MGKMSGSVSASQSKINSDYTSVTEQTGFKAGDGGFDVRVKGNTELRGAVIESTQSAIDQDRNRFSTGGALTLGDLQNKADFSAKSVSVNVGTGMSFDGALKPGGTGAGFGNDSGSASSTTLAAISGLAGNTAARTGDVEIGLQKIFDAQKVQKEIDAQTKITQTFGQLAPKAAADYAANQSATLKEQAKAEIDPDKKAALVDEARQWEDGGAYRIALHTAIGGLAGGVSGALGAGVAATAAPLLDGLQANIADSLKKAGVNETVANAAGQLISSGTAAGLGAAVSGGSIAGAAMATNVDANNRLLHPNEIALIKANAKEFAARMSANDFPMSESEAFNILKQNAADFVDAFDQSVPNNSSAYQDAQAKQFLQQIARAAGSFSDSRGLQIKYFTTETASGQMLKADFYNYKLYSELYPPAKPVFTMAKGNYRGVTLTAWDAAVVLDTLALGTTFACGPCAAPVIYAATVAHTAANRGVAVQASISHNEAGDVGGMLAVTAGFPKQAHSTYWFGPATSYSLYDGAGNGLVMRFVTDVRASPGMMGLNAGTVTTLGLLTTTGVGGLSQSYYGPELNFSLDPLKQSSDIFIIRPWLSFRWNYPK